MKRIILTFAVLFIISILNGCATVYNPATGKQEMIFIDTPSEVSIGRQMAPQVEARYPVYEDEELNGYVNRIGQRVASVSDRQDLAYHFKVVDDDSFNAFTIPGAFIYVNRGLLKLIHSDDELAAVLGHEIGHVAARHTVKQIQAQMGYSLIMDIALGASHSQDLAQALNITFNLVSSGYSREDELQADRLSVRYTSRAGFDPKATLKVLGLIQELEKSDPTTMLVFVRSHPPATQRIEAVKEELGKLGVKDEVKP